VNWVISQIPLQESIMSAISAAGGKRFRRRSGPRELIFKPRGIISSRVQKAGPEHFGIVSVDCAKARSKWLFADFYGNVHVPPTIVEHNQQGFAGAIAGLRQAMAAHDIRDVLVAVERTGRYHHPVQRAFAAAGFEARTVHPFTTKQFRLPANPGIKTDDNDLAAIHRAAVNGFALCEAQWEPFWRALQLCTRHRRDLVRKTSLLCCQIKEHLEAVFPGYGACFPTLWEHPAALRLALELGGAQRMLEAGVAGMGALLGRLQIRFQERTLQRVLAWAGHAAPPDIGAEAHRRIAQSLEEDRARKELEIQAFERQIAHALVQTPYVLLMSIVGLNVVSAAEYAGEMGPIANYANSRAITGRAGLYPSRYQSDEVDHANGKLIRSANKRLRFALLQVADNLIKCNHHFQKLSAGWKAQGKDPRDRHVRVAQRFSRISYQMVAGGQVFCHPAVQSRDYILRKLVLFYSQHGTPPETMLEDLRTAMKQLPDKEHAAEAAALRKHWPAPARRARAKNAARRNSGPQRLGVVLAGLLVELAGAQVQSGSSGGSDPT
jgi:transposase